MTKNCNVIPNCQHRNTIWTFDINQPPPETRYDEWCTQCGKHLKTEYTDYRIHGSNTMGVDYNTLNI